MRDVTDSQINAAVSGALDRLHYEKDPCVRYDSSRKLWIYLHRARTEDDFGMSSHVVDTVTVVRVNHSLMHSMGALCSKPIPVKICFLP